MPYAPRANLIGQRFGRLTVLDTAAPYITPKSKIRQRQVLVQCDCGAQFVARGSSLVGGSTTSCGCHQKGRSRQVNTRHGEAGGSHARSVEYRTWRAMIQRCENPANSNFKYYGGRGITVCERWRASYAAFLADMGRRPGPGFSIDRYPDNDGNYEPSNCRWATREQQAANKRPAA